MAPPPPGPPSRLRIRGMILTIGVAAITVVGSIYGAGLKAQQENKQMQRKVAADVGAEDELIAALETRKRALLLAKADWEKKAAVIHERIAANQQKDADSARGDSSLPGK